MKSHFKSDFALMFHDVRCPHVSERFTLQVATTSPGADTRFLQNAKLSSAVQQSARPPSHPGQLLPGRWVHLEFLPRSQPSLAPLWRPSPQLAGAASHRDSQD